MPPVLLMLASLLAAPPGYLHLRRAGDCDFFQGPRDDSGAVVFRAECSWADLQLEETDRVLRAWQDHDRVFSTVASAELDGSCARGARVLHVHRAPLLADRQVRLCMWVEEGRDGYAYRWTPDPQQPPLQEDRVQVLADEGFWQLRLQPQGLEVVSQMRYHPGGKVPMALVRWFQSLGLARFVEELREDVLAQRVAQPPAPNELED